MPDPRYEIKINVKSKSVLSFMAMRFFVRANILFCYNAEPESTPSLTLVMVNVTMFYVSGYHTLRRKIIYA